MPSYVIKSSEEDLMHHGILGQRKGRRRYQNPDGSLTPLGRLRYGVGGDREKKSSDEKKKDTSKKTHSDFVDAKEGKDWKTAEEYDKEQAKKVKKSSKNAKSNSESETKKETSDTKDKPETKKETSDTKAKEKKKEDAPPDYETVGNALNKTSSLSKALAGAQIRALQADKQRVMKSLDLSNMTDDELRKAINRMSTEDTYRRLTAERIEYGRQKTIDRLNTIGDIAAVGSSVIGLYAAIRRARR